MRCIYYIYSISSLCVSREMVYLQILSLHLPMDYVLWYCFLFMRFSDLKNNNSLNKCGSQPGGFALRPFCLVYGLRIRSDLSLQQSSDTEVKNKGLYEA